MTQRDIQRWRRQVLKTQSLSTYTWNNKVAHLRAIFGFGIKKGLLPQTENPLCEASVAKEAKKKKTLNKDQMIEVYLVVQKFAEYETQQRVPCDRRRNALYPARYWLTVLDVLRYTGMRFNQLQHIRLKDVRPGEGVIELQLEGSKTHREWCVPIVAPLKAPPNSSCHGPGVWEPGLMIFCLMSAGLQTALSLMIMCIVRRGPIRRSRDFSGVCHGSVVFWFLPTVSGTRWRRF